MVSSRISKEVDPYTGFRSHASTAEEYKSRPRQSSNTFDGRPVSRHHERPHHSRPDCGALSGQPPALHYWRA